MPSQQNQDQLKAISQNVANARSIILTDNTGLSANDQVKLRASIKESGGELKISKNTLIKLALKNHLSEVPDALDEALNGPTAIIYAFEDAVGTTKLVVDYLKDHEGKIALKAGLLAGSEGGTDKVLSVSEIESLAKLPSRQELLAKLVGQLNAPITGLVQVLVGPQRKLVYALEAIRKQKDSN